MRKLLLLRGISGCGKSTFVKENNLEDFTISSDSIRLMLNAPVYDRDLKYGIDQSINKETFDLLHQILHKRFKNGAFTVIDATNIRERDVNKLLDLAEKYAYKCYYYQFDVSIEQAKERNRQRVDYKQVPEYVIEQQFNLLQNEKLNSKRISRIYNLDEILVEKVLNLDKYDEILVIGDIQSCYSVLERAISKSTGCLELDKNKCYIFLGDILDRGVEHYATFVNILEISKLDNVIMVEGNHDIYPYIFASNLDMRLPNEFKENTLPNILKSVNNDNLDEFKKSVRKWYRGLRECLLFEYNNQKYICTHGGISNLPKNLPLLNSKNLIKGFGDYSTDIDNVYSQNYVNGKCDGFIQIHGHRNTGGSTFSICLEDSVEFGGNLSILKINKGGHEILKFKNFIYKKMNGYILN